MSNHGTTVVSTEHPGGEYPGVWKKTGTRRGIGTACVDGVRHKLKGEVACHIRIAEHDSLLALAARIETTTSPVDSYLFCVNFFSSDTVSACRPLRRRAASTLRPPLVDMRAMKPNRRLRGIRFG